MTFMTSNKNILSITVTLRASGMKVENIPCKIFLSAKLVDPIKIEFYLNEEQAKTIGYGCKHFWKSSIYGEVNQGSNTTKIEASTVYITKWPEWPKIGWNKDVQGIVAEGKPADLEIIETFGEKKKLERAVTGNFWLSPNIFLSHPQIFLRDFTGKVNVKSPSKFKFCLANRRHVLFAQHSRWIKNDEGDDITFRESVGEFRLTSKRHKSEGVNDEFIQDLDDFLLLTSFASRRRCICLGWDLYKSGTIIKHFRREVTIPSDINKRQDYDDTVIDDSDFQEFILKAYTLFNKMSDSEKEMLRNALYNVISIKDNAIEHGFIILFSALEILLLIFRKKHNLEYILPADEFKKFIKRGRKWLRGQPEFKSDNNKKRREQVYDKGDELNRVSFGKAFREFCGYYSLFFDDLWPVVGEDSLSFIRNSLVHGAVYNPEKIWKIWTAMYHLQWIVERAILAMLGWPIAQSKVNAKFLSNLKPYLNWKEDRTILCSSPCNL